MRARWQCGCAFLVATFCGCSSSSTGTPGYAGSGASGSGASSGSGSASGGGSSGGSGPSASGSVAASGSTSGTSSDDAGQTQGPTGDASSSDDDGGSSAGNEGGTALVTYPPLKFSAIGTATKISGQFYFTEGPVWDPTKNILYFVDINAHQGGTTGGAIYTLTLPSTISVFFQPTGNADGLGLDPDGNIIAAGYGSRDVWRLTGGTTKTVLAPCSSGAGSCYNGKELNTPDDITSRSDGVIYFTDPTFAQQEFAAGMTLSLSGAQGVYRLTKDGVLHLEDTTTSGPNGVNFSPDEKTLYVAYTSGDSVSKFSVAADGSLSNKTHFANATLADSMCVDAGGNVYVGTETGLAVFNPAGTMLGTISCGGDIVTNCAFGGTDQKTLFITSHSTSTLIATPTMGTSSLYQVENMPVPGIPGQN